jgi:hypothetical protein
MLTYKCGDMNLREWAYVITYKGGDINLRAWDYVITYKCGDINLRGVRLRDYLQMWWHKHKGREIIWLLTNVVI